MFSPVKWLTDKEYRAAPVQEKALAWASTYVGREEEGKNAGPFVATVLRAVGLGTGHAWCAAFVSYCLLKAGTVAGPKANRFRVRAWFEWARADSRLYSLPQRGFIAYRLNRDGTGHMGLVVGVADHVVRTIEANTSDPNDTDKTEASEREGDGVYRKVRRSNYWQGYIKWW